MAAASRGAGSATIQIAEAFKLVASSDPGLAENADDLAEVTSQAILLSQAAGDDLKTSVDTTLSSLAQFGRGAESAGAFVDILAAGAKVGAVEIPGETVERRRLAVCRVPGRRLMGENTEERIALRGDG